MAGIRCPICSRFYGIPDYLLQADVYCPGCHTVFRSISVTVKQVRERLGRDKNWRRKLTEGSSPLNQITWPVRLIESDVPTNSAQTAVESSVPTANDPPSGPRLVTPHLCHQCRGKITTPIGKASTTIDCPQCQRRTSIYAQQFHCPARCQSLLEAPLSQEGKEATCPACNWPFTIPFEVIFAEAPEPGGQWFTFRCNACRQWLVASKAAARTPGICPHCRTIMEVPTVGSSLLEQRIVTSDVRDPKLERCRHCLTLFPVSLTSCPCCRQSRPPVPDTVRD